MTQSKHKKIAKRKRITVTRTQVDAARAQLAADRLLGRGSDPAVEAIAQARRVAVRVSDSAPLPAK